MPSMTLVVNFSARARSAPKMAFAWSRTWRWKLSIRSSSGGQEHMPNGSQRCFQSVRSRSWGRGRSSQVRHESACPGSRLTIRAIPQPGTSARSIPIRSSAGSPEEKGSDGPSGRSAYGYSRAVSASISAKSSPAVCFAATTSEYRSGVSRRSTSERFRTYRK
jgi:hypothetical protein